MRPDPTIRTLAILLVTLGSVACGESTDAATIERGEFVETYVALRTAALQRGMAAVDEPLRDSVLAEAGVTEEELLTFADVHGGDLEFMRGVWADVSARLDSIRFEPVGVSGGASSDAPPDG